MPVTVMYFVHGSTPDNENHLSSGWSQPTLSPLGIRQTLEAAAFVEREAFDAILSSDLIRARESAEILFEKKKLEILYDWRLRECDYGRLNGEDSSAVDYARHIDAPFPGGESLKDVERRISRFLRDLKERFDGKRVALVAHRAPQLAIEVCTREIGWSRAIADDWRNTGKWRPGWEYTVK